MFSPATEELPSYSLEQKLLTNFVAEKTGEDVNDSEDDEPVEPEHDLLITNYSDALQWANELKLFATASSVLSDITSLEDKLQIAFLISNNKKAESAKFRNKTTSLLRPL